MAKSVITDAVLADMNALAPLNFFKAGVIGEVHGISPKAVVASAKRREIEYIVKPRVSKDGTPVVTKEGLLKDIGNRLSFETAGGEKATKVFLTNLVKALDELT